MTGGNSEPCGYEHEYEGYVFLCPYLSNEEHVHAPEGQPPYANYVDEVC
jgi:hypothetical protein